MLWSAVGEAGVAVDDRMQVDAAGSGAAGLGPVRRFRLVRAAAVDPPAAVGDPTDLLHIHRTMWPATGEIGARLSSPDGSRNLRRFSPSRARTRPTVRTEIVTPSLPSSTRIRLADHFRVPTQLLDPGHHYRWGRRRLPMRDRRPVLQAQIAVAAMPVHPLRRTRPRDTHLGGNMGDRTSLTAPHQTLSTLHRQRGIAVSHERVLRTGR